MELARFTENLEKFALENPSWRGFNELPPLITQKLVHFEAELKRMDPLLIAAVNEYERKGLKLHADTVRAYATYVRDVYTEVAGRPGYLTSCGVDEVGVFARLTAEDTVYANGLLPLVLGILDDSTFKCHQYMIQKGSIKQEWGTVALHTLGTVITVLDAPERVLNREHRAMKLNEQLKFNLREATSALGRPDVARLMGVSSPTARVQAATAAADEGAAAPQKVTPEKSDGGSEEDDATTESFRERYGASFPRRTDPSLFSNAPSTDSDPRSESEYEYSGAESEDERKPAADTESMEDLGRQAAELDMDSSDAEDDDTVQEETGYMARLGEDDTGLDLEEIEAFRDGYAHPLSGDVVACLRGRPGP